MKEWSLKYFQQIDGKPAWVAGYTGIGPRLTTEPKEALRFKTQREAMKHPSYPHPTCLVEIEEAPTV